MELYSGGALAGAKEALSSLSEGAVDATAMTYSYTPSELPVHAFLGEITTDDYLVAGPALTEVVLLNCPQCQAEQKENNIKILTNPSGGTTEIMCAGDPVVTVDDLRGRKFRAAGNMGEIIAGLGGTPVSISYSETYEALQRGNVDCNLMAVSQLESAQLWDVVSSVTRIPLGNFNAFSSFAVNGDIWEGYSPEIRRAWLDQMPAMLANHMRDNAEAEIRARNAAEAEHGVTFTQPDPDLVAAVSERNAGMIDGQIAAARSRGVEDPEAIQAAFSDAIDKWRDIVGSIGADGQPWDDEDWAAYQAAITAEIYDKVDVGM